MVERITCRSGGAILVGETVGAGTPVVCLHAGVADRRSWRAQLPALGQHHLAIAYDRRGFGETTSPDEAFSHVGDLLALLEARGLDRVVLVGGSQGGRIAIDFSLAHPERVRALVLVAPAISGSADLENVPEAIADRLAELDAAEEVDDIERINAIEAHLWLDGPLSPEGRVGGATRQLFLDMNEIALRAPEWHHRAEPASAVERLGELIMPVLLICGDLDFPHLLERHAHLAVLLPDARARILPGSAHLPNLEQPAAFNALLTGFLDQVAPPG